MLQKESPGQAEESPHKLFDPSHLGCSGCYDTFTRYTHTWRNLCALRSYIYNSPVYKHLLLSGLLILSPWSISTSFLHNPSSILPCGQRLYKRHLMIKQSFNTELTAREPLEQERGEQRRGAQSTGPGG